MGTYSPSAKAKSQLTSFTLATGVPGTAVSAVQAPTLATKWQITGFAATAPAGTDGALMFYKHAKSAAALLFVQPIGELTSEEINLPFTLDSGGANDIVVEAVGIPSNAGNTVVVNLLGVAY